MTRATFTPELISELRLRVIAHNEGGFTRTRLEDLKKVYARSYVSDRPHECAMTKVRRYLEKLAKAKPDPMTEIASVLAKAAEDQPRDERGRFAETGAVAPKGQAALFADVAKPQADQALRESNAGYRASQTQVIPETRYTELGVPAAAAAGVVAGAIQGAIPALSNGKKGVVGRIITRAGAAVGGGISGGAASAASALHAKARDILGRKGADWPSSRARGKAAKAGRAAGAAVVGAGVDAANFAISAVPRAIHNNARAAADEVGATGLRRASYRARGAIAAGLVGAAIPGLAYGYLASRAMQRIGPIADAASVRRVQKAVGVPDAAEILEKASPRANMIAAAAKLAADRAKAFAANPKNAGKKIPNFRPRNFNQGPSAATPDAMAARINARVRAVTISSSGAALAAIGGAAAAGGATAGGMALGERVYPRDERGRFTFKERAVASGVAALAGAAAGLALVRGRNTRALRALAENMKAGRSYRSAGLTEVVADPLTGKPMKGPKGTNVIRPVAARVERTEAGALKPGAQQGLFGEKKAATVETILGSPVRLDPRDVGRRYARKQRYLWEQANKKRGDALAAAALQQGDDLARAAAGGHLKHHDWKIGQIVKERIGGVLAEPTPTGKGFDKAKHDFWPDGTSADVRKKVRERFAKGESIDSLLTPAQKARIDGLTQAGENSKAAYAKEVADFHARKTAATDVMKAHATANEGAQAALKAADDRLTTAKAALKGGGDEAATLAANAEFGAATTARAEAKKTADAATKQLTEASNHAAEFMAAEANMAEAKSAIKFPRGTHPFTGNVMDGLPTAQQVEDFTAGQVAKAKRKFDEEGLKVYNDALDAHDAYVVQMRDNALKLSRRQTRVDRATQRVSDAIGPRLAQAARDVQLMGGEISHVVRAKLGNGPSRFAAYAKTAGANASDWFLGTKEAATAGKKAKRNNDGFIRHLKDPTTRNLGLAGVLGAGSAIGAVDYGDDGEVNFSFTRAKDAISNLRSGPPKPVYRVFNPGSKDKQVIVTGVITTVKMKDENGKPQKVKLLVNGQVQRGGGAPQDLPPMSRLDDVIRQVRNEGQGGGQNNHKPRVPGVDNQTQDTWAATRKQAGDRNVLVQAGEDDLGVRFLGGNGSDAERTAGQGIAEKLHQSAKNKSGEFGGGTGFQPRDWFDHLGAALDGEGDISHLMSRKQKMGVLLGDDQRKGLFPNNVRQAVDGGDATKISQALAREFDGRNKTKIPQWNDAGQQTSLRRAVRFIAARGDGTSVLSDGQLAGLDQAIAGKTRNASPAMNAGGGSRSKAAEDTSHDWSAADLDMSVKAAAEAISTRYKARLPEGAKRQMSDEMVSTYLERALAAAEGEDHLTSPKQRLDWAVVQVENKLKKADAPDMAREVLRKFDETRIRRQSKGSDKGGEFAPKAGGGATAAPASHTARGPAPAAKPDQRGYFEPVRFGEKLGNAIGAEAGFQLAAKYLPPGVLPKSAMARIAINLAAAMATGAVGGYAGQKAGEATYTARGRVAPPRYDPTAQPTGDQLAATTGAVTGGLGLPAVARGAKAVMGRLGPKSLPLPGGPAARFVGGKAIGLAAGQGKSLGRKVAAGATSSFALGVAGQLAGEQLATRAHHALAARLTPDQHQRAARALGTQ